MNAARRKSLERAAAAVGGKIAYITDDWVQVIGPCGSEADFWNTEYGWIHAIEKRDGSYSTSTDYAYARRTGRGGAVSRDVDTLAFMAGVPTSRTPAAAIRSYFGDGA